MANYKSQYTGKQIDEAVAKALNGSTGGTTIDNKRFLNETLDTSINQTIDIDAYIDFMGEQMPLDKISIADGDVSFSMGENTIPAYQNGAWLVGTEAVLFRYLIFNGDIPQWVIDNSIGVTGKLFKHTIALTGIGDVEAINVYNNLPVLAPMVEEASLYFAVIGYYGGNLNVTISYVVPQYEFPCIAIRGGGSSPTKIAYGSINTEGEYHTTIIEAPISAITGITTIVYN